MHQIKIIVEKHPDGYVAYPLGIKGVVVGEGDSYEAALADVKSAIKFHVETFDRPRRRAPAGHGKINPRLRATR
ncbi:MAG TPA: hypothetical protein VKU44_03750 [Terriglobia bacterium]|nr:hypothetical protein [Terriglobia bacterium]